MNGFMKIVSVFNHYSDSGICIDSKSLEGAIDLLHFSHLLV